MLRLIEARGAGVIDARGVNNQTEAGLAITTYIKKLELDRLNNLSPLTVSKYSQCLRVYEKWLVGEPISQDTAKSFLNFLGQKGFSQSTIAIYYHAIKAFLRELGIPLHDKFRRRERSPIHPHNPAQIQAILEAAEHRKDKWGKLAERDSLIILVFAYTGMRRQELLNLCVRDIDFYDHKIYVVNGKGGKHRTIPIADCIYDRLKKYTKSMGVSDRIFPIQPRRLWKIVSKYARIAGVANFHPHSFRHFYATQLVKNGVNLKVVKQLLGHADISTTEIYLDIEDSDCTEAVNKHLPNIMGGKK